jgi:hypothetical protein
MLIPNKVSICVPPNANTIKSEAAVTIANLDVLFFSALSILVVKAMKTGALPIGLITTNNAIMDLAKSDRNSGDRIIDSMSSIK